MSHDEEGGYKIQALLSSAWLVDEVRSRRKKVVDLVTRTDISARLLE